MTGCEIQSSCCYRMLVIMRSTRYPIAVESFAPNTEYPQRTRWLQCCFCNILLVEYDSAGVVYRRGVGLVHVEVFDPEYFEANVKGLNTDAMSLMLSSLANLEISRACVRHDKLSI